MAVKTNGDGDATHASIAAMSELEEFCVYVDGDKVCVEIGTRTLEMTPELAAEIAESIMMAAKGAAENIADGVLN